MVRLKHTWTQIDIISILRLNSTMVRLKRTPWQERFCQVFKSQFHYGSIKTDKSQIVVVG